MVFELERFVSDCLGAAADAGPEPAIREIVERAVSTPDEIRSAIGEPARAEVQALHVSDELTVLNVIWGAGMTVMPHEHTMWAIIGVYAGREDNIFWRRLDGAPGEQLEAATAKSLGPGDAVPLGRDIVHSVTNPTAGFTGAIHVYGGNFFTAERSEWDPQTLREQPYDLEHAMKLFEDANSR